MLVQARGHRGHAREIMTCTIRGSRAVPGRYHVMFMGAAVVYPDSCRCVSVCGFALLLQSPLDSRLTQPCSFVNSGGCL